MLTARPSTWTTRHACSLTRRQKSTSSGPKRAESSRPPTASYALRRKSWHAPIAKSTSHHSPTPWFGVDGTHRCRLHARRTLRRWSGANRPQRLGSLTVEHGAGERDRRVVGIGREEAAERARMEPGVAVEEAHERRFPSRAQVAAAADTQVLGVADEVSRGSSTDAGGSDALSTTITSHVDALRRSAESTAASSRSPSFHVRMTTSTRGARVTGPRRR